MQHVTNILSAWRPHPTPWRLASSASPTSSPRAGPNGQPNGVAEGNPQGDDDEVDPVQDPQATACKETPAGLVRRLFFYRFVVRMLKTRKRTESTAARNNICATTFGDATMIMTEQSYVQRHRRDSDVLDEGKRERERMLYVEQGNMEITAFVSGRRYTEEHARRLIASPSRAEHAHGAHRSGADRAPHRARRPPTGSSLN